MQYGAAAIPSGVPLYNYREERRNEKFLFRRDIFLPINGGKNLKGGEILKPYKYLNLNDRELFEKEYAAGARVADIAGMVGIHVGTAYKELARGYILDEDGEPMLDQNQRQAYSAAVAQRKAQEALRRRGKRHASTAANT